MGVFSVSLRFIDVLDAAELKKELEKVKVNGKMAWLTISKFRKPKKDSKYRRRKPHVVVNHVVKQSKVWTPKDRSFSFVVSGSNNTMLPPPPPIMTGVAVHVLDTLMDVHPLKSCSLIGRTRTLANC